VPYRVFVAHTCTRARSSGRAGDNIQ